MRPIEEPKLALLAKRSREIAELAHLLAEAAAGHAERVQAEDPDRSHPAARGATGHETVDTRLVAVCPLEVPPHSVGWRGKVPPNFPPHAPE